MTIFKGKVERVRDSHVEGWLAGAGSPPELELHIDAQLSTTAWAQPPQSDGRMPFRIAIPDAMRDGVVHKISVKVKGAPVFLNAIPLISVIEGGGEGAPEDVAAPPPLPPARTLPLGDDVIPSALRPNPSLAHPILAAAEAGEGGAKRRAGLFQQELKSITDGIREDQSTLRPPRLRGFGEAKVQLLPAIGTAEGGGRGNTDDGTPSDSTESPQIASAPVTELPPAKPPLRKPGRGGVPVRMPGHLAGYFDGVSDTYAYGWIVDKNTPGPVDVSLHVDNQPAATVRADIFRPDLHTAGTSDGHCGFHIEIPAQFYDDRPHRIDIRLPSDPTFSLFPPTLAVVSPKPQAPPIPPTSPIQRDCRIYIDRLLRGHRRLLIRGRAAHGDASPITDAVTLRLGDATLTLPQLEARDSGHAAFTILIDLAATQDLPATLHIATASGQTGEVTLDPAAVRRTGQYAQLAADGVYLSGHYIDLHGDVLPGQAQLRGPDGDVLTVPLTPMDIHGVTGPVASHFTVAAADLLNPAQTATTVTAVLIDARDRTLATAEAPVAQPVRLNLERVDNGRLIGWMVNRDRPDQLAQADLYIDGVRFSNVIADGARQDLIDAGRTRQGGGIDVPLFNPGDNDTVEVRFTRRHSDDVIPADITRVPVSPPPEPALATAWRHRLHARNRAVTVIALTGTTADLNQAIAATNDDIVLRSPDTETPKDALTGLRVAAWSDPRIATASALSDRGGAFAVPEPGFANALPPGFTPADQARLVRHAARGTYPRIPTANSFCLYLRRDALTQVGGFDSSLSATDAVTDWCLRAARHGLIHVADDRTWVSSTATVEPAPAVTARYAEYARLSRAFHGQDMLGVQWRIRRAVQQTASPPKPRFLYVIATRTGGTPQTNRDLMQALSGHCDPYVLASNGSTLELLRYDDGPEDPTETLIERIELPQPIEPGLHRSADYDDAVARLLLIHAFEMVHIRHLAWHGAGLPQVCKTLGIPVIFSLHDFYTVCPTIKLLDQDNVHCAGHCTVTAGDCAVELWPQDAFPPLKHAFVHRWRDIFAEAFAACDAFVTTSPGARALFTDIYPSLRDKPFHVIPHGRSFPAFEQLAAEPSPDQPLKVLVPGNISHAKGAGLINAVIDLDPEGRIAWHLLGDSGKIKSAPQVTVHGAYRRDDFIARVADIAPHIGAVLSIWPETWCHTLTEMWACGLPVTALNLGAVGERLAEHGGGWNLPGDITPHDLLAHLLAIRAGADWSDRVAQVAAWQSGAGARGDIHAMGEAYLGVYNSVMNPPPDA